MKQQINTFNPCDECKYSYSKNNELSNMCKMCEFKQYINLEEQGLILKLPCKVGDVVYWITTSGVVERYVTSMDLIRTKHVVIKLQPLGLDGELYPYSTKAYIEQFGKEIFLTKAEAEKALADMRCNNGEM